MIDFASALYLGMRHASSSLRPWDQLTAGKPAALEEVDGSEVVASRLAALQGCEAATLGTSTLHLVWDIFSSEATTGTAIYLDAGAYPILRWGVERAAARGVPVRSFRRHSAEALARLAWQARREGLRPLVVTDGLCPASGEVAPLREYLECAEAYGGSLVVDDTQALGILGLQPTRNVPYGRGGGGSLRWLGLESPNVTVIASMAKGFGVPAAVLAGNRKRIEKYAMHSETRVHSSPPSVAAVRAAESALAWNSADGDRLRARLAYLVRYFQRALRKIGVEAAGGLFPVQTITALSSEQATRLHFGLGQRDIRTVLHRGQKAQISFLINVGHQLHEIEHAASVAAQVLLSIGNGKSLSAMEGEGNHAKLEQRIRYFAGR
jgi:8-amino-7-oxononanoate synthase